MLQAENLILPAPLAREPVGAKPWPDWVEYRPCQVWGHDFSAFMAAGRDALAVLDLVSRKWIATLLVTHGRGESEHVQALYTRALEAEGLLEQIEARMIAPNTEDELPVLLAVSDNGPQMISGTTREFMALHAVAMHTGRPGTRPTRPTSRASSDTSRPTGHTWRRSVTRPSSPPNLTASGSTTTPSGSTPASATSRPTTNTKDAATPSAKPDATA